LGDRRRETVVIAVQLPDEGIHHRLLLLHQRREARREMLEDGAFLIGFGLGQEAPADSIAGGRVERLVDQERFLERAAPAVATAKLHMLLKEAFILIVEGE